MSTCNQLHLESLGVAKSMWVLLGLFPCSPSFVDHNIYIFKIVLHQQIFYETSNNNQREDPISHGLVMVIGSACLLIFGLNT